MHNSWVLEVSKTWLVVLVEGLGMGNTQSHFGNPPLPTCNQKSPVKNRKRLVRISFLHSQTNVSSVSQLTSSTHFLFQPLNYLGCAKCLYEHIFKYRQLNWGPESSNYWQIPFSLNGIYLLEFCFVNQHKFEMQKTDGVWHLFFLESCSCKENFGDIQLSFFFFSWRREFWLSFSYLNLVTRWWTKISISNLASSFPGQACTPLPNGTNVFGFGATWIHQNQ